LRRIPSKFNKESDITRIDLNKLIQGCISQDRASQKAVYDLYAPVMKSLCLRYTRNHEEAEEVLQDGFIRMFKSVHQFRNKGSFEGWLRKIIINSALQKFRGKYHGFHTTSLTDELYLLPGQPSDTDRLAEKELVRLIQTLPPAYRMVFNLYVFEGFKHREIAEFLGISEGTSKSNLFDARAILKKCLARELKIAR
jgi:RNA polymerase sigma factor (sigma-70 family)